jgi:hypothetical protein
MIIFCSFSKESRSWEREKEIQSENSWGFSQKVPKVFMIMERRGTIQIGSRYHIIGST